MGTLSTELAPHVERLAHPRVYADANVPAGIVTFMRERLHWDVLAVIEHDDLRRAPDTHHFDLARQLHRTLVTMDRDYLDDRRFPLARSPGVLVVWAPNERLLARTLQRIDAVLFRPAGEDPPPALPLEGRKLVVDPAWTGDVPKH
jgi:predicted nuclease of predicted toxin-antitoxin system